ncbi:MAG: type II toxin-antitoxin system VapC family toxin [Bryobacteraceae bacterium]|jgi:predicted nucleic acid-binding protein
MSILLDSDVVIEILRSQNEAVLLKWEGLSHTQEVILFSPITAAEVWGGARTNERQATSRFFNFLTCVPLDYTIGQLGGDLLRHFGKSHGLKIADALIAATAIQHNAALWTRNRKHYPMPQLTLFT